MKKYADFALTFAAAGGKCWRAKNRIYLYREQKGLRRRETQAFVIWEKPKKRSKNGSARCYEHRALNRSRLLRRQPLAVQGAVYWRIRDGVK